MKQLALVPMLASCLFAQQEIVRYTFDQTDSNRVLNFARGANAAPTFAPATGSVFGTYTTGRFGAALQHSPYVGMTGNRVQTGWHGGHAGAFTIAFWLKNGIASSVTQYSPIAGQPAWSVATGGSAGAGLQLRGWGGPDVNGDFGAPLWSLPGWNHFAVVVDPAAGVATWYRNGAAATATPIAGGMAASSGELLVGTDWVTPCGSLYAIDEFVLLGRAAAAGEITTWVQQASAMVQTIGVVAPVASLTTVSLPTLGNGTFALTVGGTSGSLFVVAAGSSYAQAGALALPFDLGAVLPGIGSQLLLVAPTATAAGVLAGGEATLPLPIPAVAGLAASSLFAQAFVLPETGLVAGNALALRIGD
jgi:hypothetical protein